MSTKDSQLWARWVCHSQDQTPSSLEGFSSAPASLLELQFKTNKKKKNQRSDRSVLTPWRSAQTRGKQANYHRKTMIFPKDPENTTLTSFSSHPHSCYLFIKQKFLPDFRQHVESARLISFYLGWSGSAVWTCVRCCPAALGSAAFVQTPCRL